ncbi:MAG: hypothetical protein JNM17_02165 [Archangium sp.]|nr:hypothetical protein [Archangium sp.]
MTRALFLFAAVSLCACVEPSLPADAGFEADAGPQRCSPLNCTGCCLANTCLGGNTNEACGYDGRTCRACSATTACQPPGACISVPQDSDAGTVFVLGDVPTDPFSGNPIIDPPRRCAWVFGRQICN